MRRIEIVIHRTGKSEVKVAGIAGGKCTEITSAIELALGKTTERRFTGEACEPEKPHEYISESSDE